MPDLAARIEQFRKMANDDPKNELGHFSLGRALLEAGQPAEAAQALQRVIALNPNLSKAHQLLAQAQVAQGQKNLAIETLKNGTAVAQKRGDLMPMNEMSRMLKDLGVEPPQTAAAQAPIQAGEGQVLCSRCGQIKSRMAHPPFSSAQGKMIHEKVCGECWQEWIRMGTKVINELRLPLSDPQAQKVFDQHMLEFLNLS